MLMRTLVSTVVIVAIVAVLLFTGAGTVDYWQAWLYLALAFTCQIAMMIDLSRRDPELLARRRRGGVKAEPRAVQKIVIWLMLVIWAALPVIAAWDRRFGWSHMPLWLNLVGALVFLAGQALMMWVLRSNSYARATVEVSQGQVLSDRGPYGIVRHPMYAAFTTLAVGVALLLGSWWALVPAALNLPILGVRLRDEESVMLADLPGYAAYKAKVRSRLLPGIW